MTKLYALLILFAAGCVRLSHEPGPVSAGGDAALGRLSADFVRGYLAWRPQFGTGLGLHEYDGKLTDYRGASLDAERARLRQFEQALAAMEVESLSAGASFEYRILQTAIKRELFSFDDLESYTRNPMTYAGAADVSIYIKRNFAPLEERLRSIIAVEDQVPGVIAAAKVNLADSLARPFVETAMLVANGSADFLATDLVGALKDVKDQSLLAAFAVANHRAIIELRGYANWLEQEKLPNAHTHYALGREKFSQMLREGELIDLPPERLLAIGLRELGREQKIFAETAQKIDPAHRPVEVFKAIQKEHPTEESLIPDTKQNLEAIRRFVVSHEILTMPSEVRAKVEETPQFARATSFASMDTPGPFETNATDAYYYVTPVEKDWPAPQKEEWLTAFNYYTTDVVSIHEAYPGHYTQFLCMNASPASKLEKIFPSYAFVEGWAHYAEQMLLEEGFGQADPAKAAKYRLAQSDEALLRLCRLCVAIKTHCEGLSVEEATRFFEENCYYEHKPAYQEALRGTYDPGYLLYTVGKLQFLKLRQDYQQQEGAAFSLRKFHDELLRHGAPPIRLLRESMLRDPHIWAQTL